MTSYLMPVEDEDEEEEVAINFYQNQMMLKPMLLFFSTELRIQISTRWYWVIVQYSKIDSNEKMALISGSR